MQNGIINNKNRKEISNEAKEDMLKILSEEVSKEEVDEMAKTLLQKMKKAAEETSIENPFLNRLKQLGASQLPNYETNNWDTSTSPINRMTQGNMIQLDVNEQKKIAEFYYKNIIRKRLADYLINLYLTEDDCVEDADNVELAQDELENIKEIIEDLDENTFEKVVQITFENYIVDPENLNNDDILENALDDIIYLYNKKNKDKSK